jgi:hypothetical protein
LTIDVSEGDLRAIAERGYEGAVSIDHDQQARTVGLFLNGDANVGPLELEATL